MINQKEITSIWINQVTKTHRNVDKILVEKVIRALLLLEGLAKQKMSFVFKGGTALMLHFNSTKRLSIDIDIIISTPINRIEEILGKVSIEQGFRRVELQHRIQPDHLKIKKEHCKFFYIPLHKTNNQEEYVLLDILYEQANYSKLISLPIQSAFIPIIGEPLYVDVPDLEDILGDKLTAFAPNTTGIPYFKKEDSMSMEIIKQLYDIGNLFDMVSDVKIIINTFTRFAIAELAYRNTSGMTIADVLEDIYQTSLCIVTRGQDGKGNFEELQKGIQRISSFIFSENYHIEKAIIHASKAAYLSVLIKHNGNKVEKFKSPAQIKDWLITQPSNIKLNKLKKSNPEAFFYLYKIQEFNDK